MQTIDRTGPRAISSRCKLNRSHDCAISTPFVRDRRAGLRPRGGNNNNQDSRDRGNESRSKNYLRVTGNLQHRRQRSSTMRLERVIKLTINGAFRDTFVLLPKDYHSLSRCGIISHFNNRTKRESRQVSYRLAGLRFEKIARHSDYHPSGNWKINCVSIN